MSILPEQNLILARSLNLQKHQSRFLNKEFYSIVKFKFCAFRIATNVCTYSKHMKITPYNIFKVSLFKYFQCYFIFRKRRRLVFNSE